MSINAKHLAAVLAIADRSVSPWNRARLTATSIDVHVKGLTVALLRYSPKEGTGLAADAPTTSTALYSLCPARGSVAFETSEKGPMMRVSGQSAAYGIATEASDLLQPFPSPVATEGEALSPSDWADKGPVARALAAASKDTTRPHVHGVYLGTEAIGTDGARLAREALASPVSLSKVVPRDVVAAVLRLVKTTSPHSMRLYREDDVLWIAGSCQDGDWAVATRDRLADPPVYDQVQFTPIACVSYDADELRAMIDPFRSNGGRIALYPDGLLAWDSVEIAPPFEGPTVPAPMHPRGIQGIGSTLDRVPAEFPLSILDARLLPALPRTGRISVEFDAEGKARLLGAILAPCVDGRRFYAAWEELQDTFSAPTTTCQASAPEAPVHAPEANIEEAPVLAPEEPVQEVPAPVTASTPAEPAIDDLLDQAFPIGGSSVRVAAPLPSRVLAIAALAPRGVTVRTLGGGTYVPAEHLDAYSADFDAIGAAVARADENAVRKAFRAIGARTTKGRIDVQRAALACALLARLYPEVPEQAAA